MFLVGGADPVPVATSICKIQEPKCERRSRERQTQSAKSGQTASAIISPGMPALTTSLTITITNMVHMIVYTIIYSHSHFSSKVICQLTGDNAVYMTHIGLKI